MRRPPEFIEVTEANGAEIARRMRHEPFIMNGLIYGAGGQPAELDVTDTVAFPWPDAITELGQLAEDAERELAGKPLPAWPISRLRLRPGDIVVVKIGMPEGMPPDMVEQYLTKCKEPFKEVLERAGYGNEIQTLFTTQDIDISVIAGSADQEASS